MNQSERDFFRNSSFNRVHWLVEDLRDEGVQLDLQVRWVENLKQSRIALFALQYAKLYI